MGLDIGDSIWIIQIRWLGLCPDHVSKRGRLDLPLSIRTYVRLSDPVKVLRLGPFLSNHDMLEGLILGHVG